MRLPHSNPMGHETRGDSLQFLIKRHFAREILVALATPSAEEPFALDVHSVGISVARYLGVSAEAAAGIRTTPLPPFLLRKQTSQEFNPVYASTARAVQTDLGRIVLVGDHIPHLLSPQVTKKEERAFHHVELTYGRALQRLFSKYVVKIC